MSVSGNLPGWDGASRTYNTANQLVSDGTNTLTYDNNGNLTSDGVNAYTWDRANRLLSMGSHSYHYDGNGARIQQTVSSIVTDYLLDVQPQLAQVIAAATGVNTEHYVHAPRGIHAMQDSSGNWTWSGQDGLGSVRSEVDNTLGVQGSRHLAPYLTPFDEVGIFAMPFVATGEQTDENDLIYLRARYYAPTFGVFPSLDPFEGVPQRPMSLNGYNYAQGNPIMNTDPSGMQTEEEWRTALRMNNFSFLNLAFDQPSFNHFVAELYHANLIPRGESDPYDFALILLINKYNEQRCQRERIGRDTIQWEYNLRLFANGADISSRRTVDDRSLLESYLRSHPEARSRCSNFASNGFSCIDETVRSSWTFQHFMRQCLPLRVHNQHLATPPGSGTVEGLLSPYCPSVEGAITFEDCVRGCPPVSWNHPTPENTACVEECFERTRDSSGCTLPRARELFANRDANTVGEIYGGSLFYFVGANGSLMRMRDKQGRHVWFLVVGAGVGLQAGIAIGSVWSEATLDQLAGLSVTVEGGVVINLAVSRSLDGSCIHTGALTGSPEAGISMSISQATVIYDSRWFE